MDVREKLVELICRFCSGLAVSDITPPYGYENLADFMISNGVTVQEWISVDDRLPEENGIYLTLNKKRQYEFHMFQTGKRMWQGIWEEDGVTHWMPLPEPPHTPSYDLEEYEKYDIFDQEENQP